MVDIKKFWFPHINFEAVAYNTFFLIIGWWELKEYSIVVVVVVECVVVIRTLVIFKHEYSSIGTKMNERSA